MFRIIIGIAVLGYLLGQGEAWAMANERPSSDMRVQRFDPASGSGRVVDARVVNDRGEVIALSQFRGRVVIVNFWAPWCPPCVQEMPMFQALQQQYARQGLEVVAVSQDMGQSVEATLGSIRTFYQRYGLTALPVYYDQGASAYSAMMIPALPTTVVLDKLGRERLRITGMIDWSGPESRQWFERLLQE